jgi:hypothetical protein
MSPEESMRTKRSASASDDAVATSTKVAGLVAAIGGWAVGMYAGFHLLEPLVATTIVWLVGKKLFSKPKQIMLPAFCVQTGHLAWFVVGMVVSHQLLGPSLVDVVWLSIGLAWLGIRPSKAALCVLTAYQLYSLPYNLLQFSHAEFGTTTNKALVVHIIWRCLALFYMARMYYRMGRLEREREASAEQH